MQGRYTQPEEEMFGLNFSVDIFVVLLLNSLRCEPVFSEKAPNDNILLCSSKNTRRFHYMYVKSAIKIGYCPLRRKAKFVRDQK